MFFDKKSRMNECGLAFLRAGKQIEKVRIWRLVGLVWHEAAHSRQEVVQTVTLLGKSVSRAKVRPVAAMDAQENDRLVVLPKIGIHCDRACQAIVGFDADAQQRHVRETISVEKAGLCRFETNFDAIGNFPLFSGCAYLPASDCRGGQRQRLQSGLGDLEAEETGFAADFDCITAHCLRQCRQFPVFGGKPATLFRDDIVMKVPDIRRGGDHWCSLRIQARIGERLGSEFRSGRVLAVPALDQRLLVMAHMACGVAKQRLADIGRQRAKQLGEPLPIARQSDGARDI